MATYTYSEAVEQTITAGEQIHQIVNGTATTEVTVEDGSKVPSIRKALLDNFYFKDPIAWQVGQAENVFNQLRQFTDGSWWYAPSASASNPISMGSTPVGDVLWKIYDFDAIGKLTPQIRESLRRSYAEAGYNLVDGSFEAGGTLVNARDVLLQERTGKGFTGPAGTVAAGTVPSGPNYINRGDETLRSALADPDSDVLVGGVEAGDVIKRLAYISLDEEFISGESDYTAAINRAFTKTKVLKLTPGVIYPYSATITIPDFCAIICDTQINSAVLRKDHNGIGLILGSYSQIKGVTHNQNNTTGTGVQVPSGFGQNIEKFKIGGGNGIGIQFLTDAGGGSNLKEIEGNTNDIDLYPTIAFTKDTKAVPRFMNGIWLAGGSIDIRGGGNGCSLVNFYISRLVTGFDTVDGVTKTVLMHISNGRIAGLGATRVYSMDDTDIVGVAIAEHIQLENCQGVKFIGGSASSYTENPANCQYNELYTRTISYTPNWTQSSGVQPSYEDAIVRGRWQRKGSTCSVYIEVTFGAATTYGNNATGWNFSLPFNGALAVNQRGIPLRIGSGATTYQVYGTVVANSNLLQLEYQGQSVRDGYPKAWAAGDRLELHFEYFTR